MLSCGAKIAFEERKEPESTLLSHRAGLFDAKGLIVAREEGGCSAGFAFTGTVAIIAAELHRDAMKNYRCSYYDFFSGFYDRFVALHSGDAPSVVRRHLADLVPAGEGDRILDICTGTGSLLPHLSRKVGPTGSVVGLDFSRGMLAVNRRKTQDIANVHLVAADAVLLPFTRNSFDAVTCSHAFYELKGENQEQVLREILRVLKPGKTFLMMEHDVPESSMTRAFFYVRMASMGAGRALSILKHERRMLEKYFNKVEKEPSPSGRSKVMICRN